MMRIAKPLTAGAAALALALTGLPAAAAEAGNVYLANVLTGPVKVTVDAQPVGELASFQASVLSLPAGEHAIAIVTEDGSSVSKVFDLDAAELTKVRENHFWCVYVLPKGRGSVYGALVMLPADKCQEAMTSG